MLNKKDLERWVEEGRTQREMAECCDVAETTIGRWLGIYGLKTNRKHNCKCGVNDPAMFSRGRFSECKKCRSRRQTDLYKRYKTKSVEYKGGECERCGYKKCLASLEFHHTDPTLKDPDWRKMRHRSFESVKKELDKCILVCRNCHGEIHNSLNDKIGV